VTDQVPAPPGLLARLHPIPTYRDHPATVGCDISGVDPGGAPQAIGILASGQPVCLLFLSSSCDGCRDLWAGRADLRRALGPGVRVVVVTRGPDEEDAGAVARLAAVDGSAERSAEGSGEVVMSSQAYRDYGVGGPPFYALAIGSEVRTEGVAWGVGPTAEAVRRALAGPDGP
jgi:hypothetical protein